MSVSVIFYAFVVAFAVSNFSNACRLEELDGQGLIECNMSTGTYFTKSKSTAQEYTTCILRTKTHVQWVVCSFGIWVKLDEREARGKKRRQQKKSMRGKRNSGHSIIRTSYCSSNHWCRAGPSVDSTPPVIHNCPDPIAVIAEPIQTYAVVTWKEPNSAHDNRDGFIRPVRRSRRGPKYSFPETKQGNSHKIIYEAKDRSGNIGRCFVYISVTVIRCSEPKKIPNGYYICHPSTEFVMGGWCRFGCYAGFTLHGPSDVTCTRNGIWSGPWPSCKPFECSALPRVEEANFTCTNRYSFRSVCSYNCNRGYGMPPYVSNTLVCANNMQWRKQGEPYCKDIEAPVFTTCPSIIISGTETGRSTGKLIWETPSVMDNSGQIVKPRLSPSSPALESEQPAGTYRISYSAEDNDDNRAMNCEFNLIVRDIRCPRLFPMPYMQISCPHGYRTGASCNISCDPGKLLVGAKTIECTECSRGPFGAWQWGNNRTTCKDINCRDYLSWPNNNDGHICVKLTPPRNGALICDKWLGGEFCQYQCKKGYNSIIKMNWQQLTVCSKSGKWVPHIQPFNCTHQLSRRGHTQTKVDAQAVFFFAGECTNETTKLEIRHNFITAVNSSLYSVICKREPSCHADAINVQVLCGASDNRIYRRSIIENDDNTSESHVLHEAKIDFQISIRVEQNATFTETQELYIDAFKRLKTLCTELVKDDSLSLWNTTFKEVSNTGIELICPNGSEADRDSFVCIPCPEGSYFKSTSKSCDACPKSTYQDEIGQYSCKSCPAKRTTHRPGSTSVNDCEEACAPGSFSLDGVVPCSLCETGYYQTKNGQTDCKQCKGSKSTISIGTAKESDCKEFDIEFLGFEKKSVRLDLESPVNLIDFYLSAWVRLDSQSSHNFSIGLLDSQKKTRLSVEGTGHLSFGINRNDTNVTYIPKDGRWHKVKVIHSLNNVTISVDTEQLAQSETANQDVLIIGSVKLIADKNFKGAVSQLNIGSMIESDVLNQNRCFSNASGDLVSWQSFVEADLTGAYINYPSSCDDYDDCLSSPCHHGSCKDKLGGVLCLCSVGFTGLYCQTNIDDCTVNVCMNNATCVDDVMDYTCLCAENTTGRYCEIEMVNGEWGNWGNWSECSTTCGEGSVTRVRLCNNPTPDNDGKECAGEAVESISCNNTDCPVCPEVKAPGNSSFSCVNTTGNLNCTLRCLDGFDFDIQPLDFYICGQETFYEWNFQTDINPLRRLPMCEEINMGNKLIIEYSAQYKDLPCNGFVDNTAKAVIERSIESVLGSIPCITTHICSRDNINSSIICHGQQKNKRSTGLAAITMKMSVNPQADNGTVSIEGLGGAIQKIKRAATDGKFTVEINGYRYELDLNQTTFDGQVKCPVGMTRVNYYCIPCSKGSYLYTDYCKKCDIGFYQPQRGQTFCSQCPRERSTLGIGSVTEAECTVHLDPVHDAKEVMGIIIGASCAALLLICGACFLYRYKTSAKKQSFTPTEPMRLFSEPSLSDRLMSSWQSKNVNFSNGCNQQENGSSPALGAYDNADVVLEEATPNTNNTDGTKTDLEKEVDKKKLPHHLKPLQKKEEHDRNQTETKI